MREFVNFIAPVRLVCTAIRSSLLKVRPRYKLDLLEAKWVSVLFLVLLADIQLIRVMFSEVSDVELGASILLLYLAISLWRSHIAGEEGPQLFDAFVSISGAAAAYWVWSNMGQSLDPLSSIVLYANLFTLVSLCIYDTMRYWWEERWHEQLKYREVKVKRCLLYLFIVSFIVSRFYLP